MARNSRGRKQSNGAGSVYRRADGRWVGQFFVPAGQGRKRKYLYGRSEKQVRELLREQQFRLSRNLPLDNERLKIGEWLGHWLRETVADSVRPKTYRAYEAMIRLHFKPALGSVRLAKLTAQDIERYRNARLADGLAPKTVRNQLTVLRQALDVAVSRDLIARNPATLVKQPPAKQYEVTALTLEDAKRLLVATASDRLSPLYALALGMGLRQSECLGLRWSDFDATQGILSVARTLQRIGSEFVIGETKTKRSRRTLFLPVRLVETLERWRVRQLEERLESGGDWQGGIWGDLMFTTPQGEPLIGYNVTRRFQTLLKAAGLQRMRFHDLRHGAATVLLALGVDMRTIMETLGHSQIHVTMNTYASVVPQLKRDAAERMDSALWG